MLICGAPTLVLWEGRWKEPKDLDLDPPCHRFRILWVCLGRWLSNDTAVKAWGRILFCPSANQLENAKTTSSINLGLFNALFSKFDTQKFWRIPKNFVYMDYIYSLLYNPACVKNLTEKISKHKTAQAHNPLFVREILSHMIQLPENLCALVREWEWKRHNMLKLL